VPTLGAAAILPATFGAWHRTAPAAVSLADKAVWDEYGLKETESAVYENAKDKLTVTAWRLNDTTGSMAAFDWQRPAKAATSKLEPLSAETPELVLLVHGNYLVRFEGKKPEPADFAAFTETLTHVDGTPLPPLPTYLPSMSLVANSERYLMGPESLAKFFPGVPPSVAAFRFQAEAVVGTFGMGKGEAPMAVFNYPTHQIAMQRETEFRKVPGAVVKRSGPLVAVVLNPPDADVAERLLGQIRYQASVTRDEYVPTKRDNIGNLVYNAFVLVGILLAFAVVSGVALGGFKVLRRRGRKGEEEDGLLTLHIDRR